MVALTDAGDEQAAIETMSDGGLTANARKAVGAAITALVETNRVAAEASATEGDETFVSAVRLMLILGLLGVLITVGIGFMLVKSFNAPIKAIAGEMRNFSVGILRSSATESERKRLVNRSDELGELTAVMAALRAYLEEIAEIAAQIAQGNLAVQFTPKSDEDELGQAFTRMVVNSNKSISVLKIITITTEEA